MSTKNKSSTKFYSNAQESYIAKLLHGSLVPGSGSPHFCVGDVLTQNWLVECKTSVKKKSSFAIKEAWLIKHERERIEAQKPYGCLAFQFEPEGENYFILSERMFKKIYDFIENYGKDNN